MTDIAERLDRCTPYGLEDFTVLKDAAEEIRRLRTIIKNYYEAEYEWSQTWDENGYNDDLHDQIHQTWKHAYEALEKEATK